MNTPESRNRHLDYLRKKLSRSAPGGKLESLAQDRPPLPHTELTMEALKKGALPRGLETAAGPETGRRADEESSALNKLSNGDFANITARDQMNLEAIVEEVGRPVVFIRGGKFESLTDQWTHFNAAPVRGRIEKAIPAIGRVERPPSFKGETALHVGTGFIVGPNLMMTNRHVAEFFVRGAGQGSARLSFRPNSSAAIDFLRENGFDPADQAASINVTDILMVHPFWDMALFAIDHLPAGVIPLTLSVTPPESLVDREVAVIGYPARSRDTSPKALELEQKHFGNIFGVKRLAPGEIRNRESLESFAHMVSAMTHDSSTLPGNSGSAIVDVTSGDIVGLHFAGITLKANYSVPAFEMARDRRVVVAGVQFSGNISPTDEWERFWQDTENQKETIVVPERKAVPLKTVTKAPAGTATWTLPLTISITLGVPEGGMAVPQAATPVAAVTESFQIPIIQPHLERRKGYDAGFLELDGDEEVPLPALTEAGESAVSRLDDGAFELKYHHFSVVMQQKRRMALFTASNVNWQKEVRLVNGKKPTRKELTGIPEGVSEEWVPDERLGAQAQLPDLFFTRDQGAFDKGHLVRRDDVVWGTFDDMQMANGDTFHVTNCSPQVADFNRSASGEDNWGDLENLIQQQTKAEKVIVFSGPVLDAHDRIFKGVDENGPAKVQVPRRYWKIVVAKTGDGPRAFGFVLEQDLTDVPLEFAVPQKWKRFQKPVSEIEGLLFGLVDMTWLKDHDAA